MVKRKILLQTLAFVFYSWSCLAQKKTGQDSLSGLSHKSDLFNSGFMDVMSNGQMNASARFLRVCIGEADKVFLPVSIYGGVSNVSFPSQSTSGSNPNAILLGQFINPLSGTFNVCIDEIAFVKRKPFITRVGLIYQLGERLLNGYQLDNVFFSTTPVHFLNTFGATGLFFQTGAWERNVKNEMGICWLAARTIFCYSNPTALQEFLPEIKTNGWYYGYSIGVGLEINKLISVKTVYYKYLKSPEIDYIRPMYQFSFQYSLNK